MRVLIVIPLLIVLIAFALSNQGTVRLGLWPTDILLDLPLSVAVLVAAGVFFVVGAFMTWGGSLSLRARARRAEQAVRRLEAQLEASRVSNQMLAASQINAPINPPMKMGAPMLTPPR